MSKYDRAYYLANKERIAARARIKREERKAYDRAYYLSNKTRLVARAKVAYAENTQREKENKRKWTERNKSKLASQRKAYKCTRRTKLAAYQRRYRQENPNTIAAQVAVRRARKKHAQVIENVDRAVVFNRDKGIYGLCYQPVDPGNWHLDHVVPLAAGGDHSYKNTQVSHPACNLSKGAKLVMARSES